MEKDGKKFAVLCAQVFPEGELKSLQFKTPEGFYFEQPSNNIYVDTWREEAGSIQINEIKKANLWVWLTGESPEVEGANLVNARLWARLEAFWLSLLMHEPPRLDSGWILTGYFTDGKPNVSRMERQGAVFRQVHRRPLPYGVEKAQGILSAIAETASVVDEALRDQLLKGRLDRGFPAFVAGVRSDTIDEAILSFVRAMEAVFQPDTKKQFCARAGTIIEMKQSGQEATQALLEELYDARSGFTHAEALEMIFTGKSLEEAIRRGRELQAFSYLFASRIYRRVFSDLDLIRQFSTEQGDYWGRVVCGKKAPPFKIQIDPEECRSNIKDYLPR